MAALAGGVRQQVRHPSPAVRSCYRGTISAGLCVCIQAHDEDGCRSPEPSQLRLLLPGRMLRVAGGWLEGLGTPCGAAAGWGWDVLACGASVQDKAGQPTTSLPRSHAAKQRPATLPSTAFAHRHQHIQMHRAFCKAQQWRLAGRVGGGLWVVGVARGGGRPHGAASGHAWAQQRSPRTAPEPAPAWQAPAPCC